MPDAEANTDLNADLNDRLDRLSAQVDLIAEELRLQRQSREMWSDLNETLVPVTRQAMDMATVEFDELSEDVSVEDATRLARTLARSLPQLEALLAQVGPLSELVHDLNSLTGAAMDQLTQILGVAEEKGYFAFARQGAFIADQVVTEYTEEDVRALGENAVTILNAVKEMTQPEVMGLVQRTAVTISESEDDHAKPPSLFGILKKIRDPQTRRGLSRVMNMLHTVGEDNPPAEEIPVGRK
jgi:uncharacterized protein YjgD (DUF1641 family)